MYKQIIIVLLLVMSISSFAQISFEKGYIINNSNQKSECLIKNEDWNNNPSNFEYKFSEVAEAKNESLKNIKEFGIYGSSKYVRANVKIDKSSNAVNTLSHDKNPVFTQEELFLKVLVESNACTLYLYQKGNLTRFFYKYGSGDIEQLVYKRYIKEGKFNDVTRTKISENKRYQQQLYANLKCDFFHLEDYLSLNYTIKSLKEFFKKYYECVNSDYITYESDAKRDVFNLNIRPGINYNNLEMNSSSKINFKNIYVASIGAELEYILPYNKNKWSLLVETTGQMYNSESTNNDSYTFDGILISELDYKSIELSLGFRYYMFLNKHSKLFTNLSYNFDLVNHSSIEFFRSNGTSIQKLDSFARRYVALGAGYKLNEHWSAEFRYKLSNNILSDYLGWKAQYNTLSLTLGYTLF